ncbi:hypothetical protein A2U01_0100485, partial [Trifolium medium]|nr:hypothetical protein [Trifolium medium]
MEEGGEKNPHQMILKKTIVVDPTLLEEKTTETVHT